MALEVPSSTKHMNLGPKSLVPQACKGSPYKLKDLRESGIWLYFPR